jgi:VWFA-related protein
VTRWLAPVVLTAAILPLPQQNPTFTSRIDAVRVDVLVKDGDKIVEGLVASDFEVFDNGVRQVVDLVSFAELPLNVVLALDMSDSVAGSRLRNLRNAGRTLLSGLMPDDQAALITFSHAVSLGADLTTDLNRITSALDDAAAFGDTALVDASFAGIVVGESDVARSLLLVFSDGLDTSSFLRPDDVFDIARRTDTVVYAVAAGPPQRAGFLGQLSALTGGTLLQVSTSADLTAVFLQILEEFRQRYLISYSPRGVPSEGWHGLEVRVRDRDVEVQARPGYLGGS